MKIKWAIILLVGVMQFSFAQQQITVSGTIRSTKNTPVPGAKVNVKNTSRTVQADLDGKYSIEAQAGEVLVFSAVGMATKEVVVKEATTNVVLEEATDKTKAEAQGTMSTITRGATSIYGDEKPLWVLNGVMLDDTINLKPEDLVSDDAKLLIAAAIPGLTAESIEKFEVLKDASMTAKYGPRAIAGVVLVTTKKGSAGSSSISYTNESTYRFIPTYGSFNIMNSQDQMSVIQELIDGGSFPIEKFASMSKKGILGKMYDLFYQLDANGNSKLQNTVEARAAYLKAAERRNTNWFSKLFQAGIMQNHTVSFSSGSEKSTYYASVSALIDPGWAKKSNLTRYSGNLNANYKISPKVRFNIISNLSYLEQNSPKESLYDYALKTSRTLDPAETYTNRYAPFNILSEINNSHIETKTADIRLQGQLYWQVTPKIEATLLGAVKYQTTLETHIDNENSNLAMAYRESTTTVIRNRNTYLYLDPDDPFSVPRTVLPEGGLRDKYEKSANSRNVRATLRYNDSFKGGLHTIQLLGGAEMDYTKRNNDFHRDFGVLYNSGELGYFTYELFKKLWEQNNFYYRITNTQNNNTSFFGNGTYTFKKRYTVNGTLRYDASNKFAKSRFIRWMPTWNIGASWQVSEESFFPMLKPLSSLSLRASYGVIANTPSVSNSLSQIYANIPWRNWGQRDIGLLIKNLANNDLSYEKNQEINLGTSIGLFNNRINVVFDWFNRKNYDLIGNVITQGVGGTINKKGNVAEMKSYGVDLSLSTLNIKKKDFTWRTSFIYSKTENKITKLLTNPTIEDMVSGGGFSTEGYALNSLFSIPFNGLNGDGLPLFSDPNGNQTLGGIRFSDRNVNFLKYSGTLIPTDKGSLANSINYKGLSLSVVFTYSYGNVVRLRDINSIYNDGSVIPRELNNRWQNRGDEAYTNIPVIPTQYTYYAYGFDNLNQAYKTYGYSDVRVAKGDNIRLKEISIGYDFNKDLLKEMKIRQLSMKLQATNVALLYADKKLNGDDPDYLLSNKTPDPKQIIFTLRVGL